MRSWLTISGDTAHVYVPATLWNYHQKGPERLQPSTQVGVMLYRWHGRYWNFSRDDWKGGTAMQDLMLAGWPSRLLTIVKEMVERLDPQERMPNELAEGVSAGDVPDRDP